MRTPTEDHLHEIIKGKDTIIVSQAREIQALEERLEMGLQLIQQGVEILAQLA